MVRVSCGCVSVVSLAGNRTDLRRRRTRRRRTLLRHSRRRHTRLDDMRWRCLGHAPPRQAMKCSSPAPPPYPPPPLPGGGRYSSGLTPASFISARIRSDVSKSRWRLAATHCSSLSSISFDSGGSDMMRGARAVSGAGFGLFAGYGMFSRNPPRDHTPPPADRPSLPETGDGRSGPYPPTLWAARVPYHTPQKVGTQRRPGG